MTPTEWPFLEVEQSLSRASSQSAGLASAGTHELRLTRYLSSKWAYQMQALIEPKRIPKLC